MNYDIFTYGTLMKGRRAASFLDTSEYLGDAVLKDYCLYDNGHYPCAVYKKGHKVYGEVYRISEEIKRRLDEYESEGYLYSCREAEVSMEGEKRRVLFYEYLLDVSGMRLFSETEKWHL